MTEELFNNPGRTGAEASEQVAKQEQCENNDCS